LGRQSLQYTGLPWVGVNGTSHSFPQSEHTVLVMVRGPDDDGPPYFF